MEGTLSSGMGSVRMLLFRWLSRLLTMDSTVRGGMRWWLTAGRVESTYEPAMTKAFLHGRTEAIRTVQPESVTFVKVSVGRGRN